jgi:hypothetical protein
MTPGGRVMQDGQLTTDSSTVRLIVLASVCVLLMAACGRVGHVLTLGSTETAVRAAGYSRLSGRHASGDTGFAPCRAILISSVQRYKR